MSFRLILFYMYFSLTQRKVPKETLPGSLATPQAWLPSRRRFFRRGQELAWGPAILHCFDSSIIFPLSNFYREPALKQPARFSRKNRPRSAALQRANRTIFGRFSVFTR